MKENKIVEDKQEILEYSNNVSSELLKTLALKCEGVKNSHDIAEQIYFLGHAVGLLVSKVVIAIDGIKQTYTVNMSDRKELLNWINEISKEHLHINIQRD